jgi:GNAT superfamily N-acetyltransferase
MMPEIVPFRREHLEDAAVLWVSRYRAQRVCTPHLPSQYQDANAVLPLLEDLASQAPGVVALGGDHVVGFLLGFLLDTFRGKRSTYSPEWANAADPEEGREIYREMYAGLSARWVADGRFTHVISLLAHDRETLDALHWLGFGMAAVDATRGLLLARGATADVAIRRAQLEDVEQVMALEEALQRHLAAAPVLLPLIGKHGAAFHERWLADPNNALWLACQGGEAVGYMRLGPASPDACHIIRDDGTASITGAFTKVSVRGQGIGTALLNHAVHWARSVGYERCAVDFEPQNISGGRFWLKHFQPVCYSVIRHVDERIAWAHANRETDDPW